MDKVNLHIHSTQQLNTECDVIVQDVSAKIKYIGKSIYIIQEAEDIKTTYKISPERLLVKRSGEIEHMQEFIVGKRYSSQYINTGMMFNIDTVTNKLFVKNENNELVIYLEYSLYINETLHGITKMTITVTERIEH